MKKKLNRKVKKLIQQVLPELHGVSWHSIQKAEFYLLSLPNNRKEALLKYDWVVQKIIILFCMLDLEGQKDIEGQIWELKELQKKSS